VRIRIVSNGMGYTTRIYDAETNEDLTERLPCTSIEWAVDAPGVAEARITMILTSVDVLAEVKRIKLENPGILDLGDLCELCKEGD